MDKKTKVRIREAILGSIKKWEKICWHKGVDKRSENCPLCRQTSDICIDCIIYLITRKGNCHGSPWSAWANHQTNCHPNESDKINCPKCKELAKSELDFLREVLRKFDAGEIYGD